MVKHYGVYFVSGPGSHVPLPQQANALQRLYLIHLALDVHYVPLTHRLFLHVAGAPLQATGCWQGETCTLSELEAANAIHIT
ncbi:hypothetical protein [Hymenobacter saemangeumensis]|uniref:hypothetical protein n=1 Tax=Hymenobacter saemangeumensis TaxID=1084522 RepID=UPI0031EC21BE